MSGVVREDDIARLKAQLAAKRPNIVVDGQIAGPFDITRRCPECGSPGACDWDHEGRPLIHAINPEEQP